jgi:hypothetical protein
VHATSESRDDGDRSRKISSKNQSFLSFLIAQLAPSSRNFVPKRANGQLNLTNRFFSFSFLFFFIFNNWYHGPLSSLSSLSFCSLLRGFSDCEPANHSGEEGRGLHCVRIHGMKERGGERRERRERE